MEKTVNNVEVIGVKKITGVDDTGTIWIELVDGSEIGLRFHPDVPGAVIVEPSKKYANLVVPEGGKNFVALDMIMDRIQRHLNEQGDAE